MSPAHAKPTATPAAEGQAQWPDRPRLVRWAHWTTFLGFLVPGLSVVGIVLAVVAKRNGEFGAAVALRNAVAVTLFLVVAFVVVVAIAFFL